MAGQFKNLQQLIDFFKDEETCKAYYEQIRWNGNITCPHCGHDKIYRTTRGYKCANKECYKKFSVTTQTIFENTKISLRTWFAAMFLISTSMKGVSSLQLASQLGITQKTSWFVLHRIREMLNDHNTNMQLKGTIEVDESYIGGKEKNKSKSKRAANIAASKTGYPIDTKVPVLGILERNGVIRVQPMVSANGEVLQPLLEANICKDAILVTDGHAAYKKIGELFKAHVVVNHAADEWKNGVFSTNNVEGFWSVFKRGYLGIYHFMSIQHLQRYCDEFAYRYNTRKQASVQTPI